MGRGTATLITDYSGEPHQFFLNLPFGEEMAAQHNFRFYQPL